MQRKSKLSKIFWKISYNNQNNNNILGKKKNFLAFILNDPRSKKIYQKTANTKSKFVPIPMQDKKKRTTHPEIWILENRNRGFATTYRNMHFSAIFFPFFSPLLLHPFYMVHAAWKSSFVPVVIDEFGKCTMATMAQHEIGNWALEPPPSSASQTSAISLWGDEIPAEVVKPLNSKSIKVDGK